MVSLYTDRHSTAGAVERGKIISVNAEENTEGEYFYKRVIELTKEN